MTDAVRPQNVVHIWPIIIGAVVSTLVSSALTAGILIYKTAEQVNEMKIAGVQQVSEWKAMAARLDGKIESLTTSVNNTERTGALIKNTLDEGIRQQLADLSRRVMQLERQVDFVRRAPLPLEGLPFLP